MVFKKKVDYTFICKKTKCFASKMTNLKFLMVHENERYLLEIESDFLCDLNTFYLFKRRKERERERERKRERERERERERKKDKKTERKREKEREKIRFGMKKESE
jgi:hypothetical protein